MNKWRFGVKKKTYSKTNRSLLIITVFNYAGLIASEGQTSAQVPQSVHTSASIT